MNSVLKAIARWQAQFKSHAFADMHRMASGISGADLPQVSVEKKERSPESSSIRFSPKRRQHLAWQRYICGGSH